MPESSNFDFAEFAAEALDAYQRSFATESARPAHDEQIDGNDLVADLLADLMHYCDLHGLDFDGALGNARLTFAGERGEEGSYRIGALVQLTGAAAHQKDLAGLPTRGTITALFIPDNETVDYYMRCPGEQRNRHIAAGDLRPAPPFPPVTTHQGLIEDPLAAEAALIDATARLGASAGRQVPARHDDIEDRHVLLSALASWTGLPAERLAELLDPKCAAAQRQLEAALDPWQDATPGAGPNRSPHPAQLAAQDFPLSPNQPGTATGPPGREPGGAGPYRPERPGPRRGPGSRR